MRDYMPSILLAGFGVVLYYISNALSGAQPTDCESVYPPYPCVNYGYQSQILRISFELFCASLLLLAGSVAVALITRWLRSRGGVKESAEGPARVQSPTAPAPHDR